VNYQGVVANYVMSLDKANKAVAAPLLGKVKLKKISRLPLLSEDLIQNMNEGQESLNTESRSQGGVATANLVASSHMHTNINGY
jgi:hypothetical protein